jgi:TrmH family RNA methyltransferase
MMVAGGAWLARNPVKHPDRILEIAEADESDLSRISSFESPPEVLAVLDIPVTEMSYAEITDALCIVLDDIRDPGNLGTIIRTADWFGIRNIICSNSCADCYNPRLYRHPWERCLM